MLTWHVDRFFRAGPLCAIATLLLPVVLAVLINAQSAEENILGLLLVGAGIIFIGSLMGSALASGFGVALFGVGTVVAEIPVALMAVVGAGLFMSLVIHDLSGSFRRAPRISRGVWRNAAITTGAVLLVSAVAFVLAYAVANLATWQSIVVPFGIAAIGFGAKLAADSHRTAGLALTAKRKSADSDGE